MKKILVAACAMAMVGPSMSFAQAAPHHMRKASRVMASGRCAGMSYGTGARRCGSATGGPVGGLSNRN